MADIPNKNEEEGGFWTGLLVGGVLGTVAGFFLGGDDKNELKRKLKEKAFDVWDNFGDFTENVKDKTLDFKDDTVDEAEDIEQKAQEAVLIAQKKIEAIADSAQQAVEQQVKEVKKTINQRPHLFSNKFFFQKGRSLQKKVKV